MDKTLTEATPDGVASVVTFLLIIFISSDRFIQLRKPFD